MRKLEAERASVIIDRRMRRCAAACRHSRPFSSSAPAPVVDDVAHCLSLVREYEYGHLLHNSLLPKPLRPAHAVLRAFNVETARVGQLAGDELKGRMRMQWWREGVERGADREQPLEHHPVQRPLGLLLRENSSVVGWLQRVIAAREGALSGQPQQDVAGMEDYADRTAGSLLYALLNVAGIGVGDELSEHDEVAYVAAASVGKALGLSMLLQSAPEHAANRTCCLPLGPLRARGASLESFYGRKSDGNIRAVFEEVAAAAEAHLARARELRPSLSADARGLLLSAALAEEYLGRLRAAEWDGFAESVHAPRAPLGLQAQLGWRAMRGSY